MVFKEAHFFLDLGAPGCYMGPLTLDAPSSFSGPHAFKGPHLLLIWGPSSLQGSPAGDCGVSWGPKTHS